MIYILIVMEQILSQIDELIDLLNGAEKKLKSARNWGVVDVLGGGFLTNLIKHSKINSARDYMSRANYLLGCLQESLRQVSIPAGCSLNIGTFSTFADFLFDGFVFDAYMSVKIFDNIHSVRELKRRLQDVRDQLSSSSFGGYVESPSYDE